MTFPSENDGPPEQLCHPFTSDTSGCGYKNKELHQTQRNNARAKQKGGEACSRVVYSLLVSFSGLKRNQTRHDNKCFTSSVFISILVLFDVIPGIAHCFVFVVSLVVCFISRQAELV